jgi:hypothetical protein
MIVMSSWTIKEEMTDAPDRMWDENHAQISYERMRTMGESGVCASGYRDDGLADLDREASPGKAD